MVVHGVCDFRHGDGEHDEPAQDADEKGNWLDNTVKVYVKCDSSKTPVTTSEKPDFDVVSVVVLLVFFFLYTVVQQRVCISQRSTSVVF